MQAQILFQNLLREDFLRIQSTNPKFSLRAYAKKTGVHVGALSSILNGKRNVSRKLVERVSLRLKFDPQKRSEILSAFPARSRRSTSPVSEGYVARYLELSAQSFKVIAEWEHFAALCLFRMKSFRSDFQWMAEKLGITPHRLEVVIERLLSLELLDRKSNGELFRTTKSVRTTDDISDASLKKCHEQSLELAKTSLYRDPVNLRDHTSITMAIDPQKISIAKELIRKFQDDLSDLLESGTTTEVYRLSMQLFPLASPGEKK